MPIARTKEHKMSPRPLVGIFALAVLGALGLAPATASAEPAFSETIREEVHVTQPFVGPCDGSPGLLTLDADIVIHRTVTQSTLTQQVTQHGAFVFDPTDDSLSTLSGHFVDRESINVNFGQLKDARQRLMTRAVGVDENGDRFPIIVTTVIHYSADGTVEVLVDDVRCGL
jgi:hypothetical protein